MLDMQVLVALALVVADFGLCLHGLGLLRHFEATFGRKDRRTALVQQSSAGISPLVFPPESQRSPPRPPQKRTVAVLKSIQILIIF